MQKTRPARKVALAAAIAAVSIGSAQLHAQQFSGAIYTSLADGSSVNANLYEMKSEVYLNGGPQNQNAAGLPDGTYFFQVTSPNGVLLSTDDAICRQLTVSGSVVFGSASPCLAPNNHPNGSLDPVNGSIPVQLIPFLDTTNNGGEYKVWLIRQGGSTACVFGNQGDPGVTVYIDSGDSKVLHFPSNCAKTDNFKVREEDGGGEEPENVLIGGTKYYDLDLDGEFDQGEPPVEGFQIVVRILDENMQPTGDPLVAFTDVDGKWGFFVDEGTMYLACEVLPVLTPTWIQTGPLAGAQSGDGTATADAQNCWKGTAGSEDTDDLDFFNVCLGAGGGKTLGFWSNKNGKAIFNAMGGLAIVNGLNLVNGSGAPTDFASYDAFRTWLLSASATNMSYMLSAQLAAMQLNATIGSVDGGSFLFAGTEPDSCSIAGLSDLGFITVNALIADANAELAADGFTPAGDPERVCQEFKKDALDDGNNNLNFVQVTPCAVNYAPVQ